MSLNHYEQSNLRNRSFKGQDLTGVSFCGSDIRGTSFTNTTLLGVDFSGTYAGLVPSRKVILTTGLLILVTIARMPREAPNP